MDLLGLRCRPFKAAACLLLAAGVASSTPVFAQSTTGKEARPPVAKPAPPTEKPEPPGAKPAAPTAAPSTGAKPDTAEKAKPASKAAQTPKKPADSKSVPDDVALGILIRNTLIALNQANLTGNYTVLRDLGSPSFQQGNTAFTLGTAFSGLRERGIDLAPVVVVDPQIAKPFINDRGMLRIKGFFPTTPERVDFEMAFEWIGNSWKLFALGAYTNPPDAPPP